MCCQPRPGASRSDPRNTSSAPPLVRGGALSPNTATIRRNRLKVFLDLRRNLNNHDRLRLPRTPRTRIHNRLPILRPSGLHLHLQRPHLPLQTVDLLPLPIQLRILVSNPPIRIRLHRRHDLLPLVPPSGELHFLALPRYRDRKSTRLNSSHVS